MDSKLQMRIVELIIQVGLGREVPIRTPNGELTIASPAVTASIYHVLSFVSGTEFRHLAREADAVDAVGVRQAIKLFVSLDGEGITAERVMRSTAAAALFVLIVFTIEHRAH